MQDCYNGVRDEKWRCKNGHNKGPLILHELRDITVSLVSPSFMRKMSLAASRFLSRLQSSFRDTNPLRSIFSTYCNTHIYKCFLTLGLETNWCLSECLTLTWASLALLKKYKEFPHRQVHSRLDACHKWKKKSIRCCDNNTAVFP